MITNERQYKITKAQRVKFLEAIESFDINSAETKTKSKLIAKAELDALNSELVALTEQIKEYEALKAGVFTELKADTLEELPILLIRARIIRGLSQKQLAETIGLKEQQIQRYESERYVSASLTRLIQIANALKINIKEFAKIVDKSEGKSNKPRNVLSWDMFPVKEMYRRNWFPNFSGSLKAALVSAEELVKEFIHNSSPHLPLTLYRKRARMGGSFDPYALLAWKCRIVSLAQEIPLKRKYQAELLDKDWFAGLIQNSAIENGPLHAKEYLENSGIPLVIEPHLPQTHLDGAAILLPNGKPLVALTLRYDRLDNFWFVLIHELIHIRDHLIKDSVEDIFDDFDEDPDEIERDTDRLAGLILLPEEIWETALPRYVRSKESVLEFSKEHNVNPAIVAGRIRKESDNYTILNDLVGQGCVRKCFAEVQFAQ
jgi:HTH-type transcriptional regulator/antitoxin HigA